MEWLKKLFCFHKYEHIETHSIHHTRTEPIYFINTYKCKKCGKTKYTYEY